MPSANLDEGTPPRSTSSSSTKLISISLASSKSKPITLESSTFSRSQSSTNNSRKRPHSSLNDDDSDPDTVAPIHQPVSAFDHSAGGAISANGVDEGKAKEPLVIQGLRNRDWREESRRKRGKNLLPHEVQAQRPGQVKVEGDIERDEVSKVSGLQFVMKDEKDRDGDIKMENMDALVTAQRGEDGKQKPRTADEEALEALMGDGTQKSALVVPAVSQAAKDEDWRNGRAGAGNEDDHFRSDVAARPDMASLDDYARVPVEEFGLGMLRGMGWKEGEVVGKRKDQVSKARIVERRPALLGIGAKEVPGGAGEELGAWGKVTRGGKKIADKTYNPVVLKNSKTGEMLTEEELQAKKEKQVADEREWRERRDRNLREDEEKKNSLRKLKVEAGGSSSRRRERNREGDHRSSKRERSRSRDYRHGSSRRERSKSRERRHRSRMDEFVDEDRREKGRKLKIEDKRDDSQYSRHNHRSREEYDDTRRRTHEVY